MDEDEEETAPESDYFTKRAKYVPRLTHEGLKAAAELVKKQLEKNLEPQKTTKVQKTNRKEVKKAKKILQDINEVFHLKKDVAVESSSDSEIELSSAAKRRLKRYKREQKEELRRVVAANEEIFSALNNTEVIQNTDVEAPIDDDSDKSIFLTISYLSEVSRIKCEKTEKFSAIFPRVAELFKLKASEFLLCHNENNIAISDTPESLNLTSCDILDCIPYIVDKNTDTNVKYDENRLKIFFQTSYSREKVSLVIHKLEKMQNVMDQYSKLQDLALNDFAFEFDGERITGSETAEDLDMDAGNCIDVIVFNPSIKMISSKRRAPASTDNCATTLSVNSASGSHESPTATSSAICATTLTVTADAPSSPENPAPVSSRKRASASHKKRTPAESEKRAPAKSRKEAPAESRKQAPALRRKRSSRNKNTEKVVTVDSDSGDTDIVTID